MDILYTRKSKAKKVKNSDGEWMREEDPLSHEMQVNEILKSRESENYTVFSETDVSRDSSLEKRPVLLAAIDCLKNGDTLVVWKSNRLSANYVTLMEIISKVSEKKADIYITTEPDFFEEGSMPELMRTLKTAIHKYEVMNIRHNIKSALQAKKKRGEVVGHIPYGYMRSEGSKIAPNASEQNVLSLMSELYFSNRYTYRQVAGYLNREGIPNREGSPWSHSSVYRILRNRARHAQFYLKKPAQILQTA